MKSERLKKLETELNDLEEWQRLGLVPKKDLTKHLEEIRNLKGRIEEEKERLQFIKESGEAPEYVATRKSGARAPYSETPTITDFDVGSEDDSNVGDAGIDMETETFEYETTMAEGAEEEEDEEEGASHTNHEEEDEDPFSDKNRWRRGMLRPDEDEW